MDNKYICNANVTEHQHHTEIILFDTAVYPQKIQDSFKNNIQPIDGVSYELFVKLLPEDLKISSIFKDNNAGGYHKIKVQFTILGISQEVTQILESLTAKRLIIYLQGYQYKTVIGDELQSFGLTYSKFYATKLSDDTGYKVTLQGQTITPAIDEESMAADPLLKTCEWIIIDN